MGENLQPTHCQIQFISTSELHVYRFEGGPKLAKLGPFSIVWDPDTEKASVPHRLTRENTSQVCRFEAELKLSPSKNPVSIVWDPNTENASVLHIAKRAKTREMKEK